MKRIAVSALALVALAPGALWLRGLLASDATRIRGMLERMARGFNASSARRALGGLADDFREETSGMTKPEVHETLAYLFLAQRDPETKEFLFKVELGEPEIAISEAASPRTADLRVEAAFLRLARRSWESAWRVEIQAELEKRKEGWRVVRSRHRSF